MADQLSYGPNRGSEEKRATLVKRVERKVSVTFLTYWLPQGQHGQLIILQAQQ